MLNPATTVPREKNTRRNRRHSLTLGGASEKADSMVVISFIDYTSLPYLILGLSQA